MALGHLATANQTMATKKMATKKLTTKKNVLRPRQIINDLASVAR